MRPLACMHVYLRILSHIPAMPTRLWVYAPLLCTPHGPAASLSTASSAGTAGFMKSVWKAPATASFTAMRALNSGLAISAS